MVLIGIFYRQKQEFWQPRQRRYLSKIAIAGWLFVVGSIALVVVRNIAGDNMELDRADDPPERWG